MKVAGVGVNVIRGPSIDARYVRVGLRLESTMGRVDSGGLCVARLIDSGDGVAVRSWFNPTQRI